MPQQTKTGWRAPLPNGCNFTIDNHEPTGFYLTGGQWQNVFLYYSGLELGASDYCLELPANREALLELAETIRALANDPRHVVR